MGTPLCVTVDKETNDNGTVTLRHRDSTRQVRIPATMLVERIAANQLLALFEESM